MIYVMSDIETGKAENLFNNRVGNYSNLKFYCFLNLKSNLFMKRSKLLLGLVVAVFAVSSAFVTKANAKRVTYFIQSTSTACTSINLPIQCLNDGEGCTDPNTGKQLFRTQASATTCQNPVRQ